MKSIYPRRTEWCARRESNPHILRYWNLNPARLPIPPRARGPRKPAAYSKDRRLGKPPNQQLIRSPRRSESKERPAMPQLPPFPDEPGQPSEPVEPQPSQPGRPSEAPAEEPGHTPNIDVPSPPAPGTEPRTTQISPVG